MIASQNAIFGPEIPNTIKIAIIVISLPSAVERRKIVTEYLSRLDFSWSFFDAIQDTKNVSQIYPEISVSHNIVPGELGCFLSHREIWKQVATQDTDYTIILEDDAIILPTVNFYNLFALLRQLRIDCIRLAIDRIEHAKPLVQLGASFGTIARLTSPKFGLGCAAYALNPKAARQFLSAATSINAPLDLWFERYHGHEVPIYNLMPPCGLIFRSSSTIGIRPAAADKGIFHYISARTKQLLADCRDGWQLAILDNALRKRADSFQSGMAFWPRSKLRKYLKRLFSELPF